MIGLLQLMTAMKLSKKKGEAAAVSGVYPGFIGSRILSPASGPDRPRVFD